VTRAVGGGAAVGSTGVRRWRAPCGWPMGAAQREAGTERWQGVHQKMSPSGQQRCPDAACSWTKQTRRQLTATWHRPSGEATVEVSTRQARHAWVGRRCGASPGWVCRAGDAPRRQCTGGHGHLAARA
jgi:hypothetical protein